MTRTSWNLPMVGLALAGLLACASDAPPVALGPVDGRNLSPADTGRVRVGDPAPDFSLASYDDGVITLSGFRGSKDVILVFYRGWW
ncbi:MAG: hypothetical protein WEB90_06960 [Gemmatimonadota bacterium]